MAYGQVNPWAVGSDAMLRTLAEREQRGIEAQKRQWQMQREAEDLRIREQTAQETADIRRTAQAGLEEQRKASANAAEALRTEREEKTRTNREKQELIAHILTNPEQYDPNVVKAAQFMQIGINPTADIQTGRDPMAEIAARSEASMRTMLAGIEAREAARAGRATEATPAQKLKAKNDALRMATVMDRNGQIPEGMSLQEFAQQLEDENLSALGVEPPDRSGQPTRVGSPMPEAPAPERAAAGLAERAPKPDIHLPAGEGNLLASPAPSLSVPSVPAAPPAGQDVQGLLRNAGPGRYTLTDGSVWVKMPDGTIQQGQ